MRKKTNYKKLFRRTQKKLLKLQTQNFEMGHLLFRSTQLILILRDIVDKYIPEKKKEAFKKEIEKRVKEKELDTA